MTGGARPAPVVDRDSRPWWDMVRRHEFKLQRCGDCGTWRWPPRAMCNRCASFVWRWEEASGEGDVASWIVNHHRFSATMATPYAVVTVRLREQADLLLPGGFSGSVDDLRFALPVSVAFEDVVGDDGEPFTLLAWEHRRA